MRFFSLKFRSLGGFLVESIVTYFVCGDGAGQIQDGLRRKKRAPKQTYLTFYTSEQKLSLALSSVTFNLARYDLLRTGMAERTFDMNNDIIIF